MSIGTLESFWDRHNLITDPAVFRQKYPKRQALLDWEYEELIEYRIRDVQRRRETILSFFDLHLTNLTLEELVAVLDYVHCPQKDRSTGLLRFSTMLTDLDNKGFDGQVRSRYMFALSQELLRAIAQHGKDHPVSLISFTSHLGV
ncbi:MAG: hypothetical protein UZ21_OP11001000662 [Microgenomates bacterium OLB22]|nr:MAG: hypothetical protein UZ21_OP11001000662 [Microgenomates bacterium OLB22]